MKKKKTKKKSHNKSRASLVDLTAEYSFMTKHGGRKPLDLTSIYRKINSEVKLQWRNSKGHVSKPNKKNKLRYELVDKKNGKVIYKSPKYRVYKKIPSIKQIIKTSQSYINKGKGRAWQSVNLKEGKDKNTIEIEFETP